MKVIQRKLKQNFLSKPKQTLPIFCLSFIPNIYKENYHIKQCGRVASCINSLQSAELSKISLYESEKKTAKVKRFESALRCSPKKCPFHLRIGLHFHLVKNFQRNIIFITSKHIFTFKIIMLEVQKFGNIMIEVEKDTCLTKVTIIHLLDQVIMHSC